MSHNPLDEFQQRHEFLVGIDSDGCAFDTMEIKHKECFIPNFIRCMGLQAVSKYAREACEFANLYSKWRGANRFIAYTLALDLLEDRPEVQARHAKIPPLAGLREWIGREDKLGNPVLQAEVARTGDPDLTRALEWSVAVNQAIDAMVHGIGPFPGVRESLEKLGPVADILVCSATPHDALVKEWQEHDIARFVSDCAGRPAICGQEAGSKKQTLGQAASRGYPSGHVLMIGDAPGDLQAAQANHALFYPINPGHEEQSWQRFVDEACDRFLGGTYAGDYERQLIAEFDRYLPETPPWSTAQGYPPVR
ncbi:MAG TPA: HAD family hydrolase [Planctomycetaceae bacterium]|nr:HAD family hydrolase [Planctomycetaceae bacterium]